ncbi:MAG: hypothetical protein ACYSYM_05070 [Planctomycetota bacterium]|jgi:hypothetical protein
MAFVEHFHGLLGGVGHMAQGVTFHARRRFGNGRSAYSGNLLYFFQGKLKRSLVAAVEEELRLEMSQEFCDGRPLGLSQSQGKSRLSDP